jgi:hypothetical protein
MKDFISSGFQNLTLYHCPMQINVLMTLSPRSFNQLLPGEKQSIPWSNQNLSLAAAVSRSGARQFSTETFWYIPMSILAYNSQTYFCRKYNLIMY